MKAENSTIGPDELAAWRKRLGLTQQRVMEIAGHTGRVPWRTWATWESGERPVPWYAPAVMEYVERRVAPG
jgi:DNA-binding transcriptional regulator YiaG